MINNIINNLIIKLFCINVIVVTIIKTVLDLESQEMPILIKQLNLRIFIYQTYYQIVNFQQNRYKTAEISQGMTYSHKLRGTTSNNKINTKLKSP